MKQGVSLLFRSFGCAAPSLRHLGSDRLYNPRNWLPWRRPKIWIGFGEPILPLMDWPQEKERLRSREVSVRNLEAEGAPLPRLSSNGTRFATASSAAHERGLIV